MKTIPLETAREVMEALLAGEKLIWKGYGDSADGETYIYLSKSGYLSEEDGAGLKADRLDLTYRGEDPDWRIIKI